MTSSAPERSVLALDIGGTKIEAGLVDPHGQIIVRERIATVPNDPRLIEQVLALLKRVRGTSAIESLGVGCGGPMRGGGLAVSPLNIPAWREFPLRASLSSSLDVSTFIDNDAKALALAEGRFGGAQELANYLSMVVSTGVGGGVVVDGHLLDGRDGNAGHVGHVIVEPFGRQCACGARGCLEAEVSGAAIAAITGAPPMKASDSMRRRAGDLVGRAVGSVAAMLDLDRCFVAGSVALGFGVPFFTAANEAVSRDARLDFTRSLRIEPSELGADGPLLGAACVAWRGTDQ